MPAKFDKGILKLPGKLDDTAGTEFRRMQPGGAANWHNGPRYQYVITLSGHGEVEVAGGKKVPLGPGSIDLIEDLKGKGHITRNFDERLTVWIPLADAPGQ
jgi:mannose-6-phosphate isomerase-like protein (cupin superfamily)